MFAPTFPPTTHPQPTSRTHTHPHARTQGGNHKSSNQFKAHLAKMKAENAAKKAAGVEQGQSAFSRDKNIGQQRRSLPVYTIRDELMQVGGACGRGLWVRGLRPSCRAACV